jgi:hypothetical protein
MKRRSRIHSDRRQSPNDVELNIAPSFPIINEFKCPVSPMYQNACLVRIRNHTLVDGQKMKPAGNAASLLTGIATPLDGWIGYGRAYWKSLLLTRGGIERTGFVSSYEGSDVKGE